MRHRIFSVLSLLISLAVLTSSVPVFSADVTSADYAADELKCNGYDVEKYLTPFWEGNIVYNEVVFPITDENGLSTPLSLMYDATEIVSVKDYTLRKTYVEGKDYTLEDGKLVINPKGSIRLISYTYVHHPTDPDNLGWGVLYPHRDGTGYEYWPESAEYSLASLAVTYIHNDTWHSTKPENVSDKLPQTMSRLVNGEKLNIVLVGDSVSTGALASAALGIAPFADAYPAMTLKGLRLKFDDPNVTLVNTSVGGTISTWTPEQLDSQIVRHAPDLVIMNYGMNDSSFDRVGISDEEFETNMRGRIEYVRRTYPDCEFILLSSLYGNIYTFPKEKYESHAAILHKIAADTEGVAAVDPQSIERPFLESGRKRYIDFMADNMVHPNDLGMRLMAQSIVDALSLTEIKPYADTVLGDLTGKANPFAHEEDGKCDELIAFLRDAKARLYACADEWEVNSIRADLASDLDAILRRCQPDAHSFTCETTPAACNADGFVTATCSVCGYTEITETIPALGGEHLWDTGRFTRYPTEKHTGVLTYTCAKCGLERTEAVPTLSGEETDSCSVLHVLKGLNYMEGKGSPYLSGDGTVEFDVCPLDVDNTYDLAGYTPYVGVWFAGGYSAAATYNFQKSRFEIVSTDLPYTHEGTVFASKDYKWDTGEWHKFAVNIKNTAVTIYLDGEKVLSHSATALKTTDNVPLIYTTGEYCLDNFRVCGNGYDPTTGEGSATKWDLDTPSSQKNFDADWAYGQFTTLEFVPGASDASYAVHVHSGELVCSVPPTCTLPGWDEYECASCGALYCENLSDPLGTAHTFTELKTVTEATPEHDGKAECTCTVCGEIFTSVIRYKDPSAVIPGDVNGDGKVNAKDAAQLMKYFAGWSITADPVTADFNGDGTLNAKDISALMIYIVAN